MTLSLEDFPAYTPEELAQFLIKHYGEKIEVLTTEAAPGGEVVEDYYDDFLGKRVEVTEAERDLDIEKHDVQERLGNLTAYVRDPNPGNLLYVKGDVHGLATLFTKAAVRRMVEKHSKDSSGYKEATHRGRLVNTPDDVWEKAIGIAQNKLGDNVFRGFIREQERYPIAYKYVRTLVASGDATKLAEKYKTETEKELESFERLLTETPELAKMMNLDYAGYLDFMIERLKSGKLDNLAFISSNILVHAIQSGDKEYKLRFYVIERPDFDGTYVSRDEKFVTKSLEEEAKELINLGFAVRKEDELKTTGIPFEKQGIYESQLRHYEVLKMLGVKI